MANYKVVDADRLDADMTAVADAIRARVGRTEELSFPEEFVSVVSELVHPEDYLAMVCNKTITEICNPQITGTLYNDFQKNNVNLTRVDLPGVTELVSGCFNFCGNLREVNLPHVLKMGSSCFEACHKITKWYFPSLETIDGWGYVFNASSSVERAYFPKLTSVTGPLTWGANIRLRTLILGADTVCSISSANVLINTPIAGYTDRTDGEMGYIYVPKTLSDGSDGVAAYQQATNWSVYKDQIRAIEDYPEVLEGWE